MGVSNLMSTANCDLKTPVRNRYFYGKLLDVYHFEMESHYFNNKRQLINRMVNGYGVVCGLAVNAEAEANTITVNQGVAIDKWGREIIVPETSGAHTVPPEVIAQAIKDSEEGAEEVFAHVLLCYHECESDPTPGLANECEGTVACQAGAIRERYRLVFKPGKAPPIGLECRIHDVVHGNKVDYKALVDWISGSCPDCPPDPCIPLANIRLWLDQEGQSWEHDDVDIYARPIVYSNDLLFELLLSLLVEQPYARGGKS